MVRRIVCLLAAAVAVLAAAPQALALPQHRADGNLSDWVGDPTHLSGETRISRGELIYDDWLYDDYGANLDQISNPPAFRSNLAPTRGDYRYPTNAARTHVTSGRCAATCCQWSPWSALANTLPSRAPK